MIKPIRLLTAKVLRDLNTYLEEDSIFTGWYSLDRLAAEGHYEPLLFSKGGQTFIPEEGPLVNTKIQHPLFMVCSFRR